MFHSPDGGEICNKIIILNLFYIILPLDVNPKSKRYKKKQSPDLNLEEMANSNILAWQLSSDIGLIQTIQRGEDPGSGQTRPPLHFSGYGL